MLVIQRSLLEQLVAASLVWQSFININQKEKNNIEKERSRALSIIKKRLCTFLIFLIIY
jgi:hypothetical protein